MNNLTQHEVVHIFLFDGIFYAELSNGILIKNYRRNKNGEGHGEEITKAEMRIVRENLGFSENDAVLILESSNQETTLVYILDVFDYNSKTYAIVSTQENPTEASILEFSNKNELCELDLEDFIEVSEYYKNIPSPFLN